MVTVRRPGWAIGLVVLVICMAVALVDVLRAPVAVRTPDIATSVDQGSAHAVLGAVNAQFAVAVSQLQRDATIPGAPTLTSGQHYVTLQVSFENRSQQQQRANPRDFQLVDALGVARSPVFLPTPSARCPNWTMADLYPGGPGSAPPRDKEATPAGRSFGPQPLCFAAGSAPTAALTLIWDPDVSLPLFTSPTRIALQ